MHRSSYSKYSHPHYYANQKHILPGLSQLYMLGESLSAAPDQDLNVTKAAGKAERCVEFIRGYVPGIITKNHSHMSLLQPFHMLRARSLVSCQSFRIFLPQIATDMYTCIGLGAELLNLNVI